jgi:outer membrane protein OmpA-like peptidoglycan-associated protein
MKIAKLTAIAALCAAVLGGAPSVMGSAGQRVGQYDFTYFTNGEQRATPVQVFDDGKSTYFQFRAGEAIPAIFVHKDNTTNLMVPFFEGPYIRVQDTAGRFTLQLGRAQAQVVYGGTGREDTPAITAINRDGMKTAYTGGGYPANANVKLLASLGQTLALTSNDALEANSYATPAKGDRVAWKESETLVSDKQIYFVSGQSKLGPQAKADIASMAAQLKGATTIVITGRDDATEKEGLEKARAEVLREAMVSMGVNPSAIIVRTGIKGIPNKDKNWPSDIHIEKVVPTAIARPSEPKNEKAAQILANIENLVRAGVITKEQGQAMLRRSGDTRTELAAATPAPAAAAPAVVTPPAPPPPPVNLEVPPAGFDFKSTDKNISTTVKRWGGATNYQIVWDAPAGVDAPITGDAQIAAASMKEALDKVITALQRKGYDIQATVYNNRVVRFTGGSKQ